MRLALRAGARGVATTAPNPPVGAVLVRDGVLLAIGHHERAGGPHAEVVAFSKLSDPALAKGSVLYVTLEPCSTQGRTPPCVDAILRHGVARVVVGCTDPNPKHAGRGLQLLRAAGVSVDCGVCETEARRLIRAFAKRITTGLPWVLAKVASTLDGRISLAPAAGRWLSNEASRQLVHRLRARVDAVMIGAGTARSDDPHLDVRGVWHAKQPVPVILSRSGVLPPRLWLLRGARAATTRVLRGPTLEAALRELAADGIQSVLLEGGSQLFGEAVDGRLIDEYMLFLAPLLAGGPQPITSGRGCAQPNESLRLNEIRMRRMGSDLCISGVVTP